MAAHFCIVIDAPNESIDQLNTRLPAAGNAHEGVIQARNLLNAILAGDVSASVQSTSRDTDPSIATSGS
jgi:hypothetical protein